jgi:16S rRNA (cytosine967-C5)-methyltransferase
LSDPVVTGNARHAAYQLLEKIAGSDLHADDLIDHELNRGILNGPDRGLFSELVFGVLRRQGTLDHYLRQLVDQSLERLEQPVLLLLRLGLYQLMYLDRVPARAAVHETVELAKQAVPRAAGLVNGVLRSFLRKGDSLVLPDRQNDPAAWLAAAHSVPRWLAEKWIGQLGLDQAAAVGAATTISPLITLRTNTQKVSREKLMQQFAMEGVAAEACRYSPEGIRLLDRHPIRGLHGFDQGLFVVQDEASQLIAHLMQPEPGESLLDICAAPGGKATHIAQLMQDRGRLVATDLKERKVRRIREGASRLGITCIEASTGDGLADSYQQGAVFDRILLDAPCSGLGVIRRNPEAKWRLAPDQFQRFAERQSRLLQAASQLLRPGGIMVYSTCSTAYEEDEAVVEEFLSRNRQFVLENCSDHFPLWMEMFSESGYLRAWPHLHDTDGFFAARIKRTE